MRSEYVKTTEQFVLFLNGGVPKCIVTPNEESISICGGDTKNNFICDMPTKEAYCTMVPYVGYPVMVVNVGCKGIETTSTILHGLRMQNDLIVFDMLH